MELFGWFVVDKPTTCRLIQLYAGKPELLPANCWFVAVPVAGMVIYRLAGIWLGFVFRC